MVDLLLVIEKFNLFYLYVVSFQWIFNVKKFSAKCNNNMEQVSLSL